jgi:hypothetical protein
MRAESRDVMAGCGPGLGGGCGLGCGGHTIEGQGVVGDPTFCNSG